MGIEADAVPVHRFISNFSPIPLMAPPPLGKERTGAGGIELSKAAFGVGNVDGAGNLLGSPDSPASAFLVLEETLGSVAVCLLSFTFMFNDGVRCRRQHAQSSISSGGKSQCYCE